MKHVYRIAGLGLILGTAVSLAATTAASARGPIGDSFGGFGEPGGLFATAFADLDKSGDGQITEEDLVAGAEARLAEVDADGNGTLTAEEFAAAVQARIAERTVGRAMGPRGMNAETMAARMAERIISARDADKDGALSLAELAPDTGFGRVIDRFDTDDDNAISQAEYDAAKAEMNARFAGRADRDGRGGKGGWNGHGFGGGRR
jgi:Ca2+-binding EF-hand superfamily protein